MEPSHEPMPPVRAMTRLLAEMQTNIMAMALPLFEGRVDRFMIFTLVARQTLDGGRATPVLALAESLGLPFETTRRHVAALTAQELCRRERGGIVATENALELSPHADLLTLAHDCLVRLIEDFRRIDALPIFLPAARAYDWQVGVRAAADLMLSVANTNQQTHHDRLDLVLFSTILCANNRAITVDPSLSRRYATIAARPPCDLQRPLRPRRLATVLSLPEATVRRRLDRLYDGPVRGDAHGLTIAEAWLTSDQAVRVSNASFASLRRLMGMLAAHGFPFDDIPSAYRAGRPTPVGFA